MTQRSGSFPDGFLHSVPDMMSTQWPLHKGPLWCHEPNFMIKHLVQPWQFHCFCLLKLLVISCAVLSCQQHWSNSAIFKKPLGTFSCIIHKPDLHASVCLTALLDALLLEFQLFRSWHWYPALSDAFLRLTMVRIAHMEPSRHRRFFCGTIGSHWMSFTHTLLHLLKLIMPYEILDHATEGKTGILIRLALPTLPERSLCLRATTLLSLTQPYSFAFPWMSYDIIWSTWTALYECCDGATAWCATCSPLLFPVCRSQLSSHMCALQIPRWPTAGTAVACRGSGGGRRRGEASRISVTIFYLPHIYGLYISWEGTQSICIRHLMSVTGETYHKIFKAVL